MAYWLTNCKSNYVYIHLTPFPRCYNMCSNTGKGVFILAAAYKTKDEAYSSLKSNFEKLVGQTTQTGSVIDMYNKVIAMECEDMYNLIEENKNPYLFTNTSGSDLDSLGYWVNLPRNIDEDDDHYKYRLKDWLLTSESSNTRAIENSILSPEYSSNIQYVPYTHGAGTGTCYVIPKVYEEETIAAALKEAQELLKNVVSPSLYIEYIVPAILGVRLECFIAVSGDAESIKSNITSRIKDYINGIAPDEQLEVGKIIRLGLSEEGVDYFNVVTYYIDGKQQSDLTKIQGLETKFLFDAIEWVDNSNLGL